MGPESAKSFAGQQVVRALPDPANARPAERAKQEADYGRRGTGYIFGAFCPATGDALTEPYPGRTTANWVDFLERTDAWVGLEAATVYAIQDNLSAHKATDVLLWSLAHQDNKLAPKTLEDYETAIKKHIAPAFGRLPLEKLTSGDIQRLYRDKQETLSASRVRLLHVVLNQALTKAVKGRLLRWSPMDGVEPPPPPRHRTTNVYDVGQVNRLLQHARATGIHMIVYLGTHTGARLGELCAIAWADVDLESGTIYVHRSLTHTRSGRLQFKATKNKDSRLITLPASAVPELRRHKAEQAQRHLLLGECWKIMGLFARTTKARPGTQTRQAILSMTSSGEPTARRSASTTYGTPMPPCSAMRALR